MLSPLCLSVKEKKKKNNLLHLSRRPGQRHWGAPDFKVKGLPAQVWLVKSNKCTEKENALTGVPSKEVWVKPKCMLSASAMGSKQWIHYNPYLSLSK